MKWAVRGARVACVLGTLYAMLAGAKPSFTAETVRERARELAHRPYQAPASTLPSAYAQLSYDQYRDIRYRPERAWWRDAGLPFQAQFFHPGFLYTSPVTLHEVEGGNVVPVRFSPDLFAYGSLVKELPPAPPDSFAGFRLTYPLNRPDHFDEVVSFLGASYFRALGRGNVYGLSARGLAIEHGAPPGRGVPLVP
ncbi:glucan biosynthesis protein [Archangium lansingense]|uniref:glucan biosynthesis protein n=1 Tax=Archangium lansingense TaxID=2995310 RepID=UPI003B7AE9A4